MQISSVKKKDELKYKYIPVDKKRAHTNTNSQTGIANTNAKIYHTLVYLESFFSSSLCLVF